MKITWLGHSCFLIETGGQRIVMDPYDATIGYPLPNVEADIVTTSHAHRDHGAANTIPGSPHIVNQSGEFISNQITITGTETFHDGSRGTKRGKNIVYKVNSEGLSLCHLGDLGHRPDGSQIKKIGHVDVLLIPVGGVYTITADEALEVAKLLHPGICIPMHYKTPALNFSLAPVEDYIRNFDTVIKLPFLEVTAENISTMSPVVVLEYQTT
ncbi:MAG: MBL fold metallo-hydrolase [Candidatus Saccharibacteria bacterium]